MNNERIFELGIEKGWSQQEMERALDDLVSLIPLVKTVLTNRYIGLFGCDPKFANIQYVYRSYNPHKPPPDWFQIKYDCKDWPINCPDNVLIRKADFYL